MKRTNPWPRLRRLAGAAMALACLAAPVRAQEKPGDADLCYKSVSTAEVTIPDVVAACSRVIATPGKAGDVLANAHNNRGAIFLHGGRIGPAIEDFSAAIALRPDAAMAYGNRGEAYRLQRDYDKAMADEETAIRLDPTLSQGYLNRGAIYAARGDYKRAIEDQTAAIALDAFRCPRSSTGARLIGCPAICPMRWPTRMR